MDKFKIGETLIATRDYDVVREFSGTTKTIRKGTKLIIGADKMGHYYDGSISPLGDGAVVEGYSAIGLAAWITNYLVGRFNIEEMVEEYDDSMDDFCDTIVEALEEIGFCEEE